MTTSIMIPLIDKAFNKAVELKENHNEDGSINWNFVESDVYIDMSNEPSLALTLRDPAMSKLLDDELTGLMDEWVEWGYTPEAYDGLEA